MEREISQAVVEKLTAFLKDHLSVESGEEAPDGRFCFVQGRNQAVAKKAAEPIPYGEDGQRTIDLVLRKVRDLYGRKEGHIWLQAYKSGSTSVDGKFKIDAPCDEAQSFEVQVGEGAIASLSSGYLAMLNMVMSDNLDLRARLREFQDWAMHMTQAYTEESMARRSLQAGNDAEQMAAAIAALGPTLEKVAPVLLQKVMGMSSPPPPPGGAGTQPATARERIAAAMAAIDAYIAQMLMEVQGSPELADDDALWAPLRELITRVGTALGATVTWPAAGGKA